jgi:hypothetical protein
LEFIASSSSVQVRRIASLKNKLHIANSNQKKNIKAIVYLPAKFELCFRVLLSFDLTTDAAELVNSSNLKWMSLVNGFDAACVQILKCHGNWKPTEKWHCKKHLENIVHWVVESTQ